MIALYESTATDFSTNGMGLLMPTSCVVAETLNGNYEVTLVHPLDEGGKWRKLIEGRILRVPVPRAMTPYVDLPDQEMTLDKTTRGAWRMLSRQGIRIISAGKIIKQSIDAGVKILVVGSEYVSLYAKVSDPTKTYIKRTPSYPTEPIPEGYTRTVTLWHHITTTSGVDGWVPGYACSNIYHTEDIDVIKSEIKESKQVRDQPFRIYKVVQELTGVTVYARHIFYDLLYNIVPEYTPEENDRGAEVIKGVLEACHTEHDFTAYSDITTQNEEFAVELQNPIEAIMGSNGVIESYGGELARDWFDIYLVNRVGADTNIQIREGKNLLGVKYEVDDTDSVSRIIPIGKDSKDKNMFLPELYIESDLAANFPYPKYGTLEVEDAKVQRGTTQEQAYQKMRDAADAAFEDGADLPTVTLDVDFINVTDTAEYEQYSWLQNIYLGDSVTVRVNRLGLTISMRMTEYEYDCLLLKYTKMSLGSVADTIASSSITAGQIVEGSITSRKIKQGSIKTGDISDDAITSEKLTDGSITSAKIGAAVIQTAHIEDGSITTLKVADGSITTLKVADGSITTLKVAQGAITSAQIAQAAIEAANIKNATITSAKIAQGTIERGNIKAATITNAEIADATITAAKIASINADVITTGTLATDRLIIRGANGIIYEINVESSGLTPTELSDEKYQSYLNGSVIVARSVTAEQIKAETITAFEIAAGTITVDRLQSGFGAQIDLTGNAIEMSVNAARETADAAISTIDEEVSPIIGDVSRWMKFSEEGLRQGRENSQYSTLIDENGFHIDKEDVIGHVGSFVANGLMTEGVHIGDILAKRTSSGGWVWMEVGT